MKKSSSVLKKKAIILILNHSCGQTIHTPSGKRWSVTQGLMGLFEEPPEALEEICKQH